MHKIAKNTKTKDAWISKSFSETFVDLMIVYTTFSHHLETYPDIPAQEAYCIPKAKSPN